MSEKKSIFVTKKLFAVVVLSFLLTMLFGMSVFAAPAAPSGLRQTSAYTNTVSISWNDVVGQDIRYDVWYSADNVSWTDASPYDLKMLQHSQYNISAGSTYYFKVRAYEYGKKEDASGWSSTLAAVTRPESIDKNSAIQTSAATSSVTMGWKAALGATRYQIYRFDSSNEIFVMTTTSPAAVVKGLKPGNTYTYRIYAERVSSNGYVATSSSWAYIYANTKPGKLSGLKANGSYPNLEKVSIGWNKISNAKGYQVAVYSLNNKRIGSIKNTNSISYYSIPKIKQNQFYKIKVRAYIQLNNGKKFYGDWATSYITNQQIVNFRKAGTAVKASWKKVSGATNYTIYMSDKSKSGYKKVATTKSTAYTLKKYGKKNMKKGKTYYVYVIANKKVGGKTYKSVADYSYSFIYR